MKYIKFLLVGIFFGIVLTKSEAVSWYRIFEMFRFESFHMYGIIGSVVVLGVIMFKLLSHYNVKTIYGEPINFNNKPKTYYASIFGGIIFGLGWALIGACPGPLYILIGTGYYSFIIILFGAILGTALYALIRHKLPH